MARAQAAREGAQISRIYAELAPYVSNELKCFGVRDADLPDLCHEVFLLVYDKCDALGQVEHVELWLRAVCRRLAANYRRRAHRKQEVLGRGAALDGFEDLQLGAQMDAVQRLETSEVLQHALSRLDPESRDLLALHDGGELPLGKLSKLVARDPKTVRKRLESARRRLALLVRQSAGVSPASAAGATGAKARALVPRPMARLPARSRPEHAAQGSFEVFALLPDLNVGTLGNVAVASFQRVSLPAIDALVGLAPELVEHCGGSAVLLAVFERTVRPPTLVVRSRLAEALTIVCPHLIAYAGAGAGGRTSMAEPITQALMLLAGAQFPASCFARVDAAAAWICAGYGWTDTGLLTPAALCAGSARLRKLGPSGWRSGDSRPGGRPRSISSPGQRGADTYTL
jgi:RNA polymerase sigma-70 factor (ECF subfamily)